MIQHKQPIDPSMSAPIANNSDYTVTILTNIYNIIFYKHSFEFDEINSTNFFLSSCSLHQTAQLVIQWSLTPAGPAGSCSKFLEKFFYFILFYFLICENIFLVQPSKLKSLCSNDWDKSPVPDRTPQCYLRNLKCSPLSCSVVFLMPLKQLYAAVVQLYTAVSGNVDIFSSW